MLREAGEVRLPLSVPAGPPCPPLVFLVSQKGLEREGLKLILGRAGFLVHGEAEDIDEARETPVAASAELFLIDVGLPDRSTRWVTDLEMLRRRFPETQIVLIDDDLTLSWFKICIEMSLDGYLSKRLHPSIFSRRLQLIASGMPLLPVEFVAQLAAKGEPDTSFSEAGETTDPIRPAETEVLTYLVTGMSNKMIGRALSVPEAAVKMRLRSLCRKINACNRTEAAIWAFKHGIRL